MAHGLRLAFAYDGDGQRVQTQLPDASTVDYSFDASGLKTVERGGYRHRIAERDLRGKTTLEELPGKAGTRSREYDALGRLTGMKTEQWSEELTYDLCGRITNASVGGGSNAWDYDDLDQIVGEAGREYVYDKLGNRLDEGAEVNEVNQRLDADVRRGTTNDQSDCCSTGRVYREESG